MAVPALLKQAKTLSKQGLSHFLWPIEQDLLFSMWLGLGECRLNGQANVLDNLNTCDCEPESCSQCRTVWKFWCVFRPKFSYASIKKLERLIMVCCYQLPPFAIVFHMFLESTVVNSFFCHMGAGTIIAGVIQFSKLGEM